MVIEAVATTANAKKLLVDLRAKSLRNRIAYGALVSGLFPVNKLATLEKLAWLQLVRPAYKPALNVGRTSQGYRAQRADVARAKYELTGNDVKVGILSNSYNNLGGAAAGVASDDLPPTCRCWPTCHPAASTRAAEWPKTCTTWRPGLPLPFTPLF